jgi:hypothetical protein
MGPSTSKPIRLEPEQHQAPACEDFADFAAVAAFERAMRTHRAHVEAFELTPLETRVDGAWRVSGSRGALYTVDIVDGSGQHDTCTCPDFLDGELGICKHLEAVRRAIRSRPGLLRSYRALAAGPARPTLTLLTDGGVTVRAVGPWDSRVLVAHGLEANGAGMSLRPDCPLLRPGAPALEGIRVAHAVLPAVVRMDARCRIRDRSVRFFRAFQDGKVGVDILNKPLFPYQVSGVLHLAARGRALLADDMGLGKTVQAIAACEVMRARGEIDRVLVVTPASLKHQWVREIEIYSGQTAVVVGGGAAQRAAALASGAPYKVLSYELTWRELARLQELDTDVLILDEAQQAKNFRTKTASTLKAIPSTFLFVLTGTPIENRLDDLYSLLQLVDPGVLGPLWRFNLDHHQQGARGKVLGCKNLARLRETIAPILLRRRKEAVLDQLPALTEQTRYTALSREQADYEESCRAEAARYMAMAEHRPLTLVEQKKLQTALLKARQACDALELADPRLKIKASPKLEEFEAYVAEIAAGGGAKILVFSEWVEMLKLAGARLDALGIGWRMLSGEVPPEKRPALLDQFREDPAIQVLLSSDAGGVGLNLQVANYVVHLDLPWNPARLDQRTARAHRLGQTRGVSVTYLCSERGIERGIEGTLAGKRDLRHAALDLASDVEEMEVQSFSIFLRQLRDVLEGVSEPEVMTIGQTGEVKTLAMEPIPDPRPVAQDALPELAGAQPVPALAVPVQPRRPPQGSRAHDRLRLAQVVLEAGFPGDAVKAAYDALAAVITTMLEGQNPGNHEAIVAAIYRDLVPAGRLAMAVPGVLARVHDLGSLERMGVAVDPGLAREVLAEVGDWVVRLSDPVPEA